MSKKFRLAHAVLLASLTLFSAFAGFGYRAALPRTGSTASTSAAIRRGFFRNGDSIRSSRRTEGRRLWRARGPAAHRLADNKNGAGIFGDYFLGLIIYGGFLWMTAGGNEENVGKAKKTIYYAVIGMLIIFAAYSITYFAFRIAFKAYIPPSGVIDKAPAQYKGQGGDYAPWW